MTASCARNAVDLGFQNALELIGEHVDELGLLDAAAGDGDHGTTMVRGLRAANDAVHESAQDLGAGKALMLGGSAFADAAGGASGALFGMFLVSLGQQLGDEPYTATAVSEAIARAAATARSMGKAEVGDKTFVDTLDPFADALNYGVEGGLDLPSSWRQALVAAKAGMESTAGMIARKGRAARLGERSRSGLDPGAVSMYYLLVAAGSALDDACTGSVSG